MRASPTDIAAGVAARLSRYSAVLMGAADGRGFLAMAGDDAYSFVKLGGDILGRAGLEKGDPIFLAGGKDTLTRLAHFSRIGIARNCDIAQRQAEIARAQFGEAETRHGENRLAIGDALRRFELDPEQQFATRIERPGIAAFEIFLG